jgi:colanic acid/amylovoran biosynthesis protein
MINGKQLIEIRRTGFVNKGAELMLYAILEKMKKEFPDAEFAMETNRGSAPYQKRALLGFYQKPRLFRYGYQFGTLFNFMPKIVKEMLGIVTDNQIDIVIDAAGFAYSDQWGTRNTHELADSCKRWKKKGTKVVLMPQAFGPFELSTNKKNILIAVNNADIVFAREKVSYDYLLEVVGERPYLKMASDFTNLVEGIVPENFDKEANRFCVVPNYRMIDKTNKKDSEAYLPFMIEVTRYAYEKGQKPFILVHEGANDLMLAEKIRDAVSQDVQIIKEAHPLKIKGILGVSSGTVGSRFHGLVSALSQGTPALATGWSHKYQMLFEDYGFPEGLLNVQMKKEELHKVMNLIIDDANKSKVTETIKQNSETLKQQSQKMWDDVMAVLKS